MEVVQEKKEEKGWITYFKAGAQSRKKDYVGMCVSS